MKTKLKFPCSNVGAIVLSLPVVAFLAVVNGCASGMMTAPDGSYAQNGEVRDAGSAAPKEDLAAWARKFEQEHQMPAAEFSQPSQSFERQPSAVSHQSSHPSQTAANAQAEQNSPSSIYEEPKPIQREETIESGPGFLSSMGDGLSWLGSALLTTLEFLGQVAVIAGPQLMDIMQGHSGSSAYASPLYPSYPSSDASGLSSGTGAGHVRSSAKSQSNDHPNISCTHPNGDRGWKYWHPVSKAYSVCHACGGGADGC